MKRFSPDLTPIKSNIVEENMILDRSKTACVFGALILVLFMTFWFGVLFWMIYEEISSPEKGGVFWLGASLFIFIGLIGVRKVVPEVITAFSEEFIINPVVGEIFYNEKSIGKISTLKEVWLEIIVDTSYSREYALHFRFDNGSSHKIDTGLDLKRLQFLKDTIEDFVK
jgi:hypothetical protein